MVIGNKVISKQLRIVNHLANDYKTGPLFWSEGGGGERKYLEHTKEGGGNPWKVVTKNHSKIKKSSVAVITMIGIFMFHEGQMAPPVMSKMLRSYPCYYIYWVPNLTDYQSVCRVFLEHILPGNIYKETLVGGKNPL